MGDGCIMGLEPAIAVCPGGRSERECQAASFNSPGQVVISGVAGTSTGRLPRKAHGTRKAVMLNVSAPFHSRLMPAAETQGSRRMRDPCCAKKC